MDKKWERAQNTGPKMAAKKKVSSVTVYSYRSERSDAVVDVVRVGGMGGGYEAGEVGKHEECC